MFRFATAWSGTVEKAGLAIDLDAGSGLAVCF
jgi:hypothetical protein